MNQPLDFGWRKAIDAQAIAEDGKRTALRLEDDLDSLLTRIENQAIVLQAFSQIIVEKLGMKDSEILEYVKAAQQQRPEFLNRKCRDCNNFIPKRKSRCIYCGTNHEPTQIGEVL